MCNIIFGRQLFSKTTYMHYYKPKYGAHALTIDDCPCIILPRSQI